MLGIDVRNSRELRATFLAIRNAGPDIQKYLRLSIKTFTLTEWRAAVAQEAATMAQSRVLAQTAKIAVSNQNIRMSGGNSAKRLAGGARISDLAHPEEFGADRDRTKTYNSSRNGRPYKIRGRHTTRQLRLPRRRGYVVYPAAQYMIPRIASVAVQTVIRTLLDIVDGK